MSRIKQCREGEEGWTTEAEKEFFWTAPWEPLL